VIAVLKYALLSVIVALPALEPIQQDHQQALFRRVFGEKIVAFDPVAVAR
jgi:hypothetical protein